MLDIAPEDLGKMNSLNFTMLNQAQQVFVFEELDLQFHEKENQGKNGTLKLLQKL